MFSGGCLISLSPLFVVRAGTKAPLIRLFLLKGHRIDPQTVGSVFDGVLRLSPIVPNKDQPLQD